MKKNLKKCCLCSIGKELEEHGFSFFLSMDEDGYSEDVTIGSYPFGYGALYLYKHHTTNEIIAGFWQCS